MAVGSKRIAAVEVRAKKMTAVSGRVIVNSEKFVSVTGKGVVSTRLKNYANDPFFLKKAAEAKAEIDRVGLPEPIIDNNIKSHANDPFVLKKVERAKQMVDKYGLPGDKKK